MYELAYHHVSHTTYLAHFPDCPSHSYSYEHDYKYEHPQKYSYTCCHMVSIVNQVATQAGILMLRDTDVVPGPLQIHPAQESH